MARAVGAEVSGDTAAAAWRPVSTRGVGARRGVRRRRAVVLAAVVLGVLILAVLLVPPVVQLDQRLVELRAANQAPSLTHPMGTDEVGRDVLVRSIYGLRVSLMIGVVAALVSVTLGGVIGLLAGSLGGWTDRVLMRVVDGVNSLPHLLFGMFIVALFSPSATAVVISVAVTHWLTSARIVRSEVLSLRSRPFVDAAISGGAGRVRIMRRHFLPHLLPHLLLATVLMVPHAIWHETSLSFLGLGLPAHMASLGNMISDGQRSLLAGAWWSSIFPGLFILAPTLAISALAQFWRDRRSPRWRSEVSYSTQRAELAGKPPN